MWLEIGKQDTVAGALNWLASLIAQGWRSNDRRDASAWKCVACEKQKGTRFQTGAGLRFFHFPVDFALLVLTSR